LTANTPLDNLSRLMLPAVEAELKLSLAEVQEPGLEELHSMLAYHLGWEGEGAGPGASGKRIRPLLVLLTTAAAGGQWQSALPAAAAIELVHNFSLIHDDIEDNSPLRRGRPTVWNKWGVPQAINAGDSMFTLAHLAMLRLAGSLPEVTTLQAARILQQTCLQLTQGQYLDIAFENRSDLSLQAYWTMVTGKTAALLAACTEIGALCAGSPPEKQQAYRSFGISLGLAFQAQDDILGIWGDSSLTGKSTASDLLSGKKSLPVVFGLQQNGPFASRWRKGPLQSEEVVDAAALLEQEGGLAYAQENTARLTGEALEALEQADPQGEAGEALYALADTLLTRTI
jgi:geranylgeranyl diphosphate synthase, type I